MHFGLIVTNQNKKKTRIKTLCILNLLTTGCSRNEAVSLLLSRSTKNFKKNWLLHMHFGLTVANSNGKYRIRTLYFLKLLCTGCSRKNPIKLLPSRCTWNFLNKWLLYVNFGWTVANRDQKTKIRRIYILKMLYTWCSTKEAVSLLLSRSTWNFDNKCLSYIHFG